MEALRLLGRVEILGLLDCRPELWNQRIAGVKVLGGDDRVAEFLRRGWTDYFMGVGSTGLPELRSRLYESYRNQGCRFLTVVHPAAFVSPSAFLGEGTVVLAGAVVHTGARVGENVIINSGAVVEHDCTVGEHSHVATGACLAGQVEVGARCHVGIGASIREGVRVGEGSVVGAGAVVVRNVPPGTVVVGVPARPLRSSRP